MIHPDFTAMMNKSLLNGHRWKAWVRACGWFVPLWAGLTACQEENPAPPEKQVFWRTTNVDAPEIYAARLQYGQIPDIRTQPSLSTAGLYQYGYVLDRAKRQLYFFSSDSLIRQMDLDLKKVEVAGNLGKNGGFGANSFNGNIGNVLFSDQRLYWSQVATSQRQLVSARVDGSERKVVYTTVSEDSIGDRGLSRLASGTALLWGTPQKVWIGQIDGSTPPSVLYDLSVDAAKGELNDLAVWKDRVYLATTQGIWVGRTDGSAPLSPLFTTETQTARYVESLSVDAATEQLYWLSKIQPQPFDGRDFQFLYRGNLDGSGVKKMLERFEGTQLQIE
jgi:hypothetical protein